MESQREEPVNPIGRALNATLGALVRYSSKQWARGRSQAEDDRTLLADLGDAMGEVLAESHAMGRGIMPEEPHRRKLAEAQGRVRAIGLRIQDDELAGHVDLFAKRADTFAARDYHHYDREGLEAAFNAASARARLLAKG